MASNDQIEILTEKEKSVWRDCGWESFDIQACNRKLCRLLEAREQQWTHDSTLEPHFIKGCLNIVLVGMGGSGKSSLGNLLLDKLSFHTGDCIGQDTIHPAKQTASFGSQEIMVLDTPGYFLQNFEARNAKHTEVTKEGLKHLDNGLHVLIFVVNLANQRNREEEVKILQDLKLLNTNSMKHCMLVGTHSKTHYEHIGVTEVLEEFNNNAVLKEFIETINNRVVLIDAVEDGRKRKKKLLPGETIPCRKEKVQARRMVMSMVGKVITDNEHEKILYTHEDMMADMGACFPAQATVHTPSGKKTMEDLHVGDDVLALSTKGILHYEPIIMFSHSSRHLLSNFVSIHTACGKVLKLSSDHLLPVKEHANLLAARHVQIGDVVLVADTKDERNVNEACVMAITKSERLTGLYCPHTPSGSILVDGILTSCYTDLMPPGVAHTAMFLVRMLQRLLPSVWFSWLLPYNEVSGMPRIVDILRDIVMSFTIY